MMFKVIVRNFFCLYVDLDINYNIVAPFYAGELLTLQNCRKNLLYEEDTFIYVHGRGSCIRL